MRVPCLDLFCHSGKNPTTISPILTFLRHTDITVCTYPGHRVKLTVNVHSSQGQGLRECECFWPAQEIPSSRSQASTNTTTHPTLETTSCPVSLTISILHSQEACAIWHSRAAKHVYRVTCCVSNLCIVAKMPTAPLVAHGPIMQQCKAPTFELMLLLFESRLCHCSYLLRKVF